MQKPNLILIHSFGTNSRILSGLTEYISERFTVYFIDLPGFIETVEPLKEVNLQNMCNFVDEKISKLNLDEYILGGISFGFLVANNLKSSKHCKAIVAIEPYVNTQTLNFSNGIIKLLILIINIISGLKLQSKIWRSGIVKYILVKTGTPSNVVHSLITDFDSITFFILAKFILTNYSTPQFNKNIPYILLINSNDTSVAADKILKVFKDSAIKLKIYQTNIEHFPHDLSANYFRKVIPAEVIEHLISDTAVERI